MTNHEVGPNNITYTDQFGVIRPIEDFGKNPSSQPKPPETPSAPNTTEVDSPQPHPSSS